jgi:hypothetical protein
VSDPLHIAAAFAQALDRDDYATATKLLAPACVYRFRDAVHEGRDAIIESYRTASAWARETFDEVAYASEIGALPDGRCAITFIDQLRHAGDAHEHRCRQIVRMNDAGLIEHIEHEDLPGQREAVDAFNRRHGIVR